VIATDSLLELVNQIHNEDIQWDGTRAGFQPFIQGATKKLLEINEESQEEIKPLLLQALQDKSRYVAAHVLLTRFFVKAFSYEPDNWNGLKISIANNGEVSYEGNDLTKLSAWWETMLH
jgi:hypothetical protein